MKNFNIHNIDASYIDQLVDLENQCFSNPWSHQAFYESFKNPNYLFLSAIDDVGVVIGYIGLYEILKEGYITNIAVDQRYRNIGIASELIKTSISFVKENNFLSLSLEVRISNKSAINLYKKFGFLQVGLRKNFYTNPQENAFIYTLYLNKK